MLRTCFLCDPRKFKSLSVCIRRAKRIQPQRLTIDVNCAAQLLTARIRPRTSHAGCRRQLASGNSIASKPLAFLQRTPANSRKRSSVGVMMAGGAGFSRVLILGASVFSIAALASDAGFAQTADAQAARPLPERPKQARRKPAKPGAEQQASSPVTGTSRCTATAPTTTRSRPTTTASPPVAGSARSPIPATTSPAASATGAAIRSTPSGSTSTTPRVSMSANGATR